MENGKKMITVVGAYMILKGILNLILGFSASNLVSLLFAAAILAFHKDVKDYFAG